MRNMTSSVEKSKPFSRVKSRWTSLSRRSLPGKKLIETSSSLATRSMCSLVALTISRWGHRQTTWSSSPTRLSSPCVASSATLTAIAVERCLLDRLKSKKMPITSCWKYSRCSKTQSSPGSKYQMSSRRA